MKRTGSIALAVGLLCVMFAAGLSAAAEYASMGISAGEIVWRPLAANGGATLSAGGPDGVAIRKVFGGGSAAVLEITDDAGAVLPDGQYTYDLVFAPASGTVTRDDGGAAGSPMSEPMIQSGTFRVTGGKFFVPSGADEAVIVPQDVVHADDAIITGSLCVGYDCATDGSESFGFDTIRLKENNTRIKFDDTSATAGFPANDWTIVANDSSSGGASYLAFEDTTGAKTPFKVMAGAPADSLLVSSSGKVGFRTATPVLDLHIYTGNTPAIRLDQSNAGGWTAQVWDIGANEANFFVRDVTGGSRLPFRIRPGAPTSSIDISASGNVGIGTSSPEGRLSVTDTATSANRGILVTQDTADAASAALILRKSRSGLQAVSTGDYVGAVQFRAHDGSTYLRNGSIGARASGTVATGSIPTDLFFAVSATDTSDPFAAGTVRMVITSTGKVGIGTTSPTHALQVCGTSGCAYNEGGTTWVNASSREYKENIEDLSSSKALDTLRGLNPVTFSYKGSPERGRVGFIAEDVPELVAMKDRKGLSPLDIVAVLTKVVQEQNRTIEELRGEVASLRGAVERISGRP